MNLDYAWEKLSAVVPDLTKPDGAPQDRLFNAYLSQLMRLEADDFPQDLLSMWQSFEAGMTAREAAGHEGNVAATIVHMSDQEAQRLIGLATTLYREVCVRMGRTSGADARERTH